MDKRHIRRQQTVQELFSASYPHDLNKTTISEKAREVLKHNDEFDLKIQEYAQKYTIDKIAKVDIAILRLAMYELLIEKKVPPKVIINEAVELAKEMGGEKSPGFINAVLGKVYESKNDETE